MINGVINVRKEKGITSFGVVSRLRKIFGQKKIGHTGTLDPDAEGVLPVCLGRATHLVEDLSHGTKSYEAVMLLGTETDTQDTGGKVLAARPVLCSEEEVKAAVFSFSGKQMQMPPMYSALKVNGQKLVDLARKGIEVKRPEREVEFSNIEIEEIALPRVKFHVTVSHGTYIRTLCHDIGQKLGCGACMESLLRTRVEEFELKDALTLDEIKEQKEAEDAEGIFPYSFLIPIDHFYRDMPAVTASERAAVTVKNGGNVPKKEITCPEKIADGESVRLYLSDGSFAGIYESQNGVFQLKKYYYDRTS